MVVAEGQCAEPNCATGTLPSRLAVCPGVLHATMGESVRCSRPPPCIRSSDASSSICACFSRWFDAVEDAHTLLRSCSSVCHEVPKGAQQHLDNDASCARKHLVLDERHGRCLDCGYGPAKRRSCVKRSLGGFLT